MRSVFAALSLAASALAYSISEPSSTEDWTTSGPNVVTWTRVDTDATNFTLVLVNQDTSIMPSGSEVLVAYVDGTVGTVTASAPSAGWPTGSGFQVNFVKDTNSLNTIYAQSNQFNITQSTSSAASSTSASASKSSAASGSTTGTSSKATGSAASASGSSSATSSDASPSATSSSGAGRVEAGLFSVFAGALAMLAF